MNYEPFDALYWFTQLDAERGAMPSHRASFATMLMGLYRVPNFKYRPLFSFNTKTIRNCPQSLLNRAYGAMAPQCTIRLASEQFRIGQTIHISSKVL